MRTKTHLTAFMIAFASILGMLSATTAAAQGRGGGRGGGPPAIMEIKPGLFVVTGLGGNSTVQVTDDGLIVVDTKNLGDENYQALMDQIRTVTTETPRYAVVTHVHQDHSGGTKMFKEQGATVVAHRNILTNLETYTSNAGVPAAPSVTYDTEHTLKLGGVYAEIHHYGAGHTSGDSIVYFPAARVVAMGDQLSVPQWNCDYAQGGSVLGWQESFARVAELDFDVAIPGHGNPISKEEFLDYKRRFDTFVSRAREAVQRGVPKEELMAAIDQSDLGWNVTMPEGVRLDGFYAEVSSAR